MKHADYQLDGLGVQKPVTNGHGGARADSGRKPAGYVKSSDQVKLDGAKARNEEAKAQRNELAFAIESQQYVSREAVRQASATAMATLAQGLRGIEDNLERRGVPIDVCQIVGKEISDALARIGNEMEMMAGNPIETE